MIRNHFPKLILINPWIYDFAAYDLWSKPLGLLYLASFIRAQGFESVYFDCLDKYIDPDNPITVRKYGTGNFRREIVNKPEQLKHIPRHYARYGVPEAELIKFLEKNRDAVAVLVTSLMTYWYPGVRKTVEIVRRQLPDTPVILGGIYASLYPGHARDVIDPDFIVTGPGEWETLRILSRLTDNTYSVPLVFEELDAYPPPAFDLINHPDYLVMMTSRGCPYNCSFCAQKQIAMPFRQRKTDAVLDEFAAHYERFRIRDFAFYDDALFINRDRHIKVILEGLIRKKIPLRLHSPNGLFARDIDAGLASLMYRSGFKTVRLSFETSNEERRKDMYSKVTNDDMVHAVERLKIAGYKTKDLDAYVMMGLPGQDPEEVIASILFVHNLGVKVRLASYSPIPGTKDFERSVEAGLFSAEADPLLTNKTIFPLQDTARGYEIYRKIRTFTHMLNDAVSRDFRVFADPDIGGMIRKVIGHINE